MSPMYMRRAFMAVCVLGGFIWFLQVNLSGNIRLLVRRFDMDTDPTPYTEPRLVWNCSKPRRPGTAEDILCMEPKQFLKNYKNPCWKETIFVRHGENITRKQVLRCLPYFHIFGVCKTGTTDLFFRLSQHPQIVDNFGALKKETWFWSWRRFGFLNHNRKMNFSNFVSIFNSQKIGNTKIHIKDGREYSDYITGHGDPMDFWDYRFWRQIPQNDPYADQPRVLTPHLVRHVQPNMKLMVMLREPAERLYSHYYHGGYGKTPEDFHKDVVAALEIMEACVALYSFRTCLYGKNITKMMNVPLTASLYYIHIKEWLDVFPREQVLILRNEDYAKNTKDYLMKIFRYLDVGDISSYQLNLIVNMPHKYETKKKKSQGPMKNETLDLLIDFFSEPNRKLAEMLNDTRFLWKDYKRRYKTKSGLHSPNLGPNLLIKQARQRTRHSAKIPSHLPYYRNMPRHQVRDRLQQEKMKRWQELKRNQTIRMRGKHEAEIIRVKADHDHLQKDKLVGMKAFLEQKRRIKELLEQKKEEIAMLQSLESGNISISKLGYQITHNLHGYHEGNGDDAATSQQKLKSENGALHQENPNESSETAKKSEDSSQNPGQSLILSNTSKSSLKLQHEKDKKDTTDDQQHVTDNHVRNSTLFNSPSLNETLASLKTDVSKLKAQIKRRSEAVESLKKEKHQPSKNKKKPKKRTKRRRKKRSNIIV